MKIQSYDDMTVELLRPPKYPAETVAIALNLTMQSDPEKIPAKLTFKLGKYLLDADHTSPLEHVSYTFLIQGVSRSFLAQITRHRIGSFTSASQHYQDYQDYPVIIQDNALMIASCTESYRHYEKLRNKGVAKEEARQVLPNAASVNLLWTINARALINFLRQRLCLRNVLEMRVFANKVHTLLVESFPEVFKHVGPQCYEDKCKQGKLQCSIGPWIPWKK